jgi:sigma-E factor negative regulatory protein RseC
MIGMVHAIAENTVTVSQGETLGCFGCMHQECKSRQQLVTAKNPLRLPLSIGQMVEIETPKAMILIQGFQVLLPPMLGFIGGFMFTGFLFPLSSDPPRAAGGVLILFLTAILTYWIRKRFPSTGIPQVARICDSPALNCGEAGIENTDW